MNIIPEALASARLDGETHVIETLPRLAISVYAPWCWAMLYGGKPLENRSHGKRKFPMVYNGKPVLGDVWLHASLFPGKGSIPDRGRRRDDWDRECVAMVDLLRSRALPNEDDLDAMRGHIVGRLRVTGHRDPDDPPDSRWYVPGSRAILVENPRPLATPIAARGALGWWPVPDDVLEQLGEAA